MPFNKRLLGPAALAAVMLAPGWAHAAPDPTGVWINDTGRGAVEIKQCSNGLCGHVVWVKDTNDAKGCGRQIVGNVKPVGAGLWDNGWIYSPERKRKYDVELKPLGNGKLRVTGYAGSKFFSKTMIWTRAPADLVRCGGDVEAAARPATAAKPVAAAKTEQPAVAPKAAPVAAPAAVAEKPVTTAAAEPAAAAAQAPTAEAPIAAPAPAEEPAADEAVADDESDTGAKEGLNLGDLKLDQFLTRTASGKCKLDLPWVKVDFACDRK